MHRLTIRRSDGWNKQQSCLIVNIFPCYLAFTFYQNEKAEVNFHVLGSAEK